MNFEEIKDRLLTRKHAWLITGVAGFIGSHLLEFLIAHDQKVIGIDNFFMGRQKNLQEVRNLFPDKFDSLFCFVRGDIRDQKLCEELCLGVDYVLHHAAISSVPFSFENPIETNEVNIVGTVNMLHAATRARVKRFVYASSSAVYGDQEEENKKESDPVDLISPYASTKYINELSSQIFPTIGLRYFNVFGHRQDPNGPYSAVIPKWISLLASGCQPVIYGTGETTRDFCHVDNVIQANILACFCEINKEIEPVFNVASGISISLEKLLFLIQKDMKLEVKPIYKDFRSGDILKSSASIEKIKSVLGYKPAVSVQEGIRKTIQAEYI